MLMVLVTDPDSAPYIIKKLNLWLRAPKGATPVNYTSAIEWQMQCDGIM